MRSLQRLIDDNEYLLYNIPGRYKLQRRDVIDLENLTGAVMDPYVQKAIKKAYEYGFLRGLSVSPRTRRKYKVR